MNSTKFYGLINGRVILDSSNLSDIVKGFNDICREFKVEGVEIPTYKTIHSAVSRNSYWQKRYLLNNFEIQTKIKNTNEV